MGPVLRVPSTNVGVLCARRLAYVAEATRVVCTGRSGAVRCAYQDTSIVSSIGYPTLAPPPDFRYVGLEAGQRGLAPAWAGAVGAGALLSLGLCHVEDPRRLLLLAGASALGIVALLGVRARLGVQHRSCEQALEMAIVPWGVLIESESRARVLHWPGIKRIQIQMIHGSDQGTPTTRFSFVTIETATERLAGRAFGGVSLERLVVHLDAYACEAGHRIALDLDGDSWGDGPSEPDCEPLLSAARAWIDSARAIDRLDLPAAGYRQTSAHGGSPRAIEVLRQVLRDRTSHEVDPRPFAAVVAAELRATELADDLVELVQSPHPVVAAVAKVAARKLGVAKARTGALDEVEPFLLRRDLETLAAWQTG
jgi:hypothetical protein